jgi:hypothetical protein
LAEGELVPTQFCLIRIAISSANRGFGFKMGLKAFQPLDEILLQICSRCSYEEIRDTIHDCNRAADKVTDLAYESDFKPLTTGGMTRWARMR